MFASATRRQLRASTAAGSHRFDAFLAARRAGGRPFRSSVRVFSKPSHSESNETAATDSESGAAAPQTGRAAFPSPPSDPSQQSQQSQPRDNAGFDAQKSVLRSSGYGSARTRAARRLAEEPQPVPVPQSFLDERVTLCGEQATRNALSEVVLEPAQEEVRWKTIELAESWSQTPEVESNGLEGELAAAVWRYHAALVQVLLLGHVKERDQTPKLLRSLRELHGVKHGTVNAFAAHQAAANPDLAHSTHALLHIQALSPQPGPDCTKLYRRPIFGLDTGVTAMLKLVEELRTELDSLPPSRRATREPVRAFHLLSVENHAGAALPRRCLDLAAFELGADVVHLDVQAISAVVGTYLGQNQHAHRGPISMLPFSVAEQLSAPPASPRSPRGALVIDLSSLRGRPSAPSHVSAAPSDERWDDIKMTQALEALIRAADRKRSQMAESAERSAPRPLIVHLCTIKEIASSHWDLVVRLRAIVDRMWQCGRQIVLVGSSAAMMPLSLNPFRRDDCRIISLPVRTSQENSDAERLETVLTNIANIHSVLASLAGPGDEAVAVSSPEQVRSALDAQTEAMLGSALFGWSRCKRVASLMLNGSFVASGLHRTASGRLRLALRLVHYEDTHGDMDKMGGNLPREASDSSSTDHHEPPTLTATFSMDASELFPGGPGGPSPFGPVSSAALGGDGKYDRYEKKLLGGLINAKDIHTTFDDIVLPDATKTSLQNLTSLALLRPDAFSYGVLKTERIPGCLLYGPPGTGKTLLAKAVARQSGASMLEVSAASINDMFVGESEKNVQAVFSLARKLSPLVVFIDEADALLGTRHSAPGKALHRETLTQFLREWDSVASDLRAFIMVATNRPYDLDEAVLRRLPRRIVVDLPLRPERASILRILLRAEQLDPETVDLDRLASQTDLYSGSDLKNLCVAAAMEAVAEENRAKAEHEKSEAKGPFVFPERRVLKGHHLEKAMAEIGPSISEDMVSLKAIRKFDEKFGDKGGRKRRKRGGMGFEIVKKGEGGKDEGLDGARVRKD